MTDHRCHDNERLAAARGIYEPPRVDTRTLPAGSENSGEPNARWAVWLRYGITLGFPAGVFVGGIVAFGVSALIVMARGM